MRTVISVISDEVLLNKIKSVFTGKSNYHFFTTSEEASDFASENEVSVAIVDYKMPVISGTELCELLQSLNPDVQIIMFFAEKYTAEVLAVYNRLHIGKLVCKENMMLDELPSHVDSLLHEYYREEEIKIMDSNFHKISEKYLKPMNEMSKLLNERMKGYDEILSNFICCIDYILKDVEKVDLTSFNTFIENIIKDYVQVYMVGIENISLFFDELEIKTNKPDQKKFFKFINGINQFESENIYDVVFTLIYITKLFGDSFPMYRGKIETGIEDENVVINAIYEIRENKEYMSLNNLLLRMADALFTEICKSVRIARKDELIRLKIIV